MQVASENGHEWHTSLINFLAVSERFFWRTFLTKLTNDLPEIEPLEVSS